MELFVKLCGANIITLTETWLDANTENCASVKDYKFIFQNWNG